MKINLFLVVVNLKDQEVGINKCVYVIKYIFLNSTKGLVNSTKPLLLFFIKNYIINLWKGSNLL